MTHTIIYQQEVRQPREELFSDLYLECFPVLARYVAQTGGKLDEARDAFQEALLRYYEKLAEGQFEPGSSHQSYVVGMAKNLYLKAHQKSSRLESWQGHESDIPSVAGENEKEPVSEKIMLYLRQAGKKCMDLLSAFYYDRLSMNDLADRFGYNSERSATVGKYKCLEKVRETIKEKSLEYEDFIA